jgi:hypothetical protein
MRVLLLMLLLPYLLLLHRMPPLHNVHSRSGCRDGSGGSGGGACRCRAAALRCRRRQMTPDPLHVGTASDVSILTRH